MGQRSRGERQGWDDRQGLEAEGGKLEEGSSVLAYLTVGGQHLSVGVDVDTLALSLLQQQPLNGARGRKMQGLSERESGSGG